MKFFHIATWLLFIGSLFAVPVNYASAVEACQILTEPASARAGDPFDILIQGLGAVNYPSDTSVFATVSIVLADGSLSTPFSEQFPSYTGGLAKFVMSGNLVKGPGTAIISGELRRTSGTIEQCTKQILINAPAPAPAPAPADTGGGTTGGGTGGTGGGGTTGGGTGGTGGTSGGGTGGGTTGGGTTGGSGTSSADCPPGTPSNSVCIKNPLTATTLLQLLNNIINFMFNLAILITPLMAVIGGFMFVTGSGDAKKISDARTLLLWTAIGFAVILLSRGLVAVLLSVLGK